MAGASGATGLWHMRIEAASGLSLVPRALRDPDGDSFSSPLDFGRRARIQGEALSNGPLPSAPSIDLTALGGSLSAQGSWPNFLWQHETVLGRDMSMRTVSHGFLYPFGHRAVIVQTVERVLQPPDGQQATAGLREERRLFVTEPVRGPVDDEVLARRFPFDEVEVLEREFALRPGRDGEQVLKVLQRPAKRLQPLRDEVEAEWIALQGRRGPRRAAVRGAPAGDPQSFRRAGGVAAR